jgi:hypothetical protein
MSRSSQLQVIYTFHLHPEMLLLPLLLLPLLLLSLIVMLLPLVLLTLLLLSLSLMLAFHEYLSLQMLITKSSRVRV